MIVKNEEAMLAQCLESVKEADNIVVVDTGSFDKTKKVAKRFTDNIFDFEWCDDFSKARNYAKSLCTGDWILSIDADEVLEEGGIQKIKDFLKSYDKDAVSILMKSSNNEFYVVRLFKNTERIEWTGRVHETLGYMETGKLDTVITYGTSPAHLFDPERNVRILEISSQENPMNSRYLYYLGREYGYKGNWVKMIETLKKYIEISTYLSEKADAYFMLALGYWNTQQGEEARLNCLMALNINANFKVACLLMAQMSFEHNAIQWNRMAETATNEGTLFARVYPNQI